MKENMVLFLTHFDDYIDVCISLNNDENFDLIRKMKSELKSKSKEISVDEYHNLEADIFLEYLKICGYCFSNIDIYIRIKTNINYEIKKIYRNYRI